MRAFTIVSALVAVAFSGVFATPGEAVSTLFARQGSAACGTDLACMCTNAMGQGIVDCGNCGINAHKSDPNINMYKNQFQTSVNSYADSCTQAGHPIGPFSVTGSSTSGGSGTSSSTTKAASGSTPTGPASNSTSTNGALSFHAAAGTSALAVVAVVMASVF